MKTLWLYLAFLLLSTSFFAQDSLSVMTSTQLGSESNVFPNCKIVLTKNGKKVFSKTNGAEGKLDLKMPVEGYLEIAFSAKGYLTKVIAFDLNSVPKNAIEGGFNCEMKINMVPKPKRFKKKVTKTPVAIYAYNKKEDDLLYDSTYTEKRQKEIRAELDRVSEP